MNIQKIKREFPIFSAHPNLVYLDNASTTQKPSSVINAIHHFYTQGNANIHRGLYSIAAKASRDYEECRIKVGRFLNAKEEGEIIFTAGTTASTNLVAQSFLAPQLNPGDEILLTAMEHHANLIPWQVLCKEYGAKLKFIPVNEKGGLELDHLASLLSEKTKMLALVHISNSLGTINPIASIVEKVRQKLPHLPILLDAAQSAAYYPLDVQALDVDFLVFSGHKIFAPTGTGVLYGKMKHLETMPPNRYGGDMIERVYYESSKFAGVPRRFEGGTPNISGVLGLGAAIDFINNLDKEAVKQHLSLLNEIATQKLKSIDGLRIIGEAEQKSAIISFLFENIHAHDIATFLAADEIAIRAGHHCTQPLLDAFGIPATTRASFSIYNTEEDIEKLVASLKQVQTFFA